MSDNLLIKQESNLFDKRMFMEAVGLEGTGLYYWNKRT
jgi:hypothetical protein